MPEAIHLQRSPCPQCRSLRTIRMDKTEITETLHCPDCGHVWDRVVLPVRPSAKRRPVAATSTTALVEPPTPYDGR
jgi:Zn ribbon nucleic-acid-binding protein